MITESDIRQTLAALRYHHRLKTAGDPTYAGSSLEIDTLAGIASLQHLADLMAHDRYKYNNFGIKQ